MTIKQQGGIFGRNPTFNDIDANSVSSTSISTNTISEKTSANGVVIDGVTLKDNAVSAPYGIDVTQGRYKSAFFGNPVYVGGAGQMNFGVGGNDLILGTTNAPIRLGSTSTNTEWARITSVGLVLPNGAGIDFSATAGTGTSELFDDYEEGTWTPAFSGNTGVSGMSYSLQEGSYTKVGNLVTANLRIIVSGLGTLTGTFVTITGLPFAATGAGQATVGYFVNVNGHKPTVGGYVASGQSVITMSATNSGNDDMIVANFPIASVTATTQLNMSVTYQAA